MYLGREKSEYAGKNAGAVVGAGRIETRKATATLRGRGKHRLAGRAGSSRRRSRHHRRACPSQPRDPQTPAGASHQTHTLDLNCTARRPSLYTYRYSPVRPATLASCTTDPWISLVSPTEPTALHPRTNSILDEPPRSPASSSSSSSLYRHQIFFSSAKTISTPCARRYPLPVSEGPP